MGDFYREKKEVVHKKDYKLGIMIAIIIFTVLIVMFFIFMVVPSWMDYWWAWLTGNL